MTTRPRLELEKDPHLEARRIIDSMRSAAAGGQTHWFLALADAIRRWPLAHEQVGERCYSYLVGGEAFDWLLLAERLCQELDGLVPEQEVEALVFHGRLPEEVETDDLQEVLGAKYRAHLNYVYGVRVERALQVAVQAEVQKERLASRIWENGHLEDEVFGRIYGAFRPELLARFREERTGGRPPVWAQSPSADLSLSDFDEFTYWLFRYRIQSCDPARVASDTRKGLAYLQYLESLRKRPAPDDGSS